MKKNIRLAAVSLLAGSLITAYTLPILAENGNYYTQQQNYRQPSNNYTQQSGYNQNNYQNATQQYTPQQYTTQQYSQNSNQHYTNNMNQNYAQNQNMPNYSQQSGYELPPLKGRVVTLPMGTFIPATATSTISSEFLTVGDSVYVTLNSGYLLGSEMALPPNTRVEGNVILSEPAGLAGKHGRLKVKFTNAITPNGQRIPLNGKIATEDGSGILIGGTGSRVSNAVKKTATDAGIGALLGTIFGAIMPNTSAGKGAIAGTATGATVGVIMTAKDKGKNAEINAGAPVNIVLEQPMTVNVSPNYNQPSQGYSPNYNY